MYPTNYYIALGTNVGNYINNFSNAIVELKKIGHVIKMANIYKSKPYGYLKQNFFIIVWFTLNQKCHQLN